MKLGLWGGLAAVALLCAPASAQGPRSVYFYNSALGPQSQDMNVATPAAWGNGYARNSRMMDFEGAPVLEVTARNFNEGARFDLRTPLDITPYQENGFIRLRVRFREGVAPQAPGMAPPGPGMEPGMGGPPGGFPGGFQGGFPGGLQGQPRGGNFNNGEAPPGFVPPAVLPQWRGNRQIGGALPPLGGAGGFPTMPEGEGGMAVPAVASQYTPIRKLQVTLMRENGATAGRINVNPDTFIGDEDGWHLFVLPVSEMRSTTNASGPVQRVVFTADKEDTFYVAQAALVIETPQILVSIRQANQPAGTQQAEITVKPGPVTLIADVEAGAADPQIEWNFDADNVGNLPPAMFGGGPPAAGGVPGGEGMMAPPGPMMGPGGAGMARPEPVRRPAAGPEVIGGEAAPQFGPRVDARGLVANYSYPNEEQNYRVEVTVRDRSGQKPPVTASILVKVRG